MRAVFFRALSGAGPVLPPGADKAALRAGLALDDATLIALYHEARASTRPATSGQPQQYPAGTVKRRRLAAIIAACIALTVLLLTGSLLQPWRSTARLYAIAPTRPSAYALLRRRAALGDAVAQFDIATILDSAWLPGERVVPKDNKAALRWYAASAAARWYAPSGGFAPAAENLGYAYNTGHGVTRDDTLAAKWYSQAAAAGLAQAQNSLGYLYQTGSGVPRNDALALHWFQMAASQGFALAQNNLGAAYQVGAGTARNYASAAQWFQRAAVQGEPNAENRLGFLYFKGLGVTQDNRAAQHWFAAAAAQGLAPAQLNLGLLYALGIGVNQDNVAAITWFLLAQERGDADATRAMTMLRPPPTSEQLRQAWLAALDWDRRAHFTPKS